MTDVLGLVLPFFGLILLGAFFARQTRQPLEALGWMNTFIIYAALPALFFQLVSRTPVEQLSEWSFVFGSVFATFMIFSLMCAGSMIFTRSNLAESTIKGLSAAYGNIGYMGPALAMLAFGPSAAVPVALIVCGENVFHFAVTPLMMALSGRANQSVGAVALQAVKRIVLHPLIVATMLGVLAAVMRFEPPQALDRLLELLAQAAAPCALFAMGVTLALRPLKRIPAELGVIAALKQIVHPALCYVVLSLIGDFPDVWLYSAVMLAALPAAANVYVLAQQYDVWVERASASVVITTALSVFTLTALLYLITTGALPPGLFR